MKIEFYLFFSGKLIVALPLKRDKEAKNPNMKKLLDTLYSIVCKIPLDV